jgi:signal transduction histidine kinase/ligand-binding sensor domain-containing protein/DNA-binding response OmpR family regulator
MNTFTLFNFCLFPMGNGQRYILVLLFLFLIRSLPAQELQPRYLTIENGLSNNSVRCIFQDHNGFMWFGTYDGLNRYDGYEFRVFRNNLTDSTSLPHNYIYSIGQDRQNRLWVGTGQGVVIYNNISGSFRPAFYKRENELLRAKIGINASAIQGDKKGNVFIGTNGLGLLIQKAGEETAIQVPYIPDGNKRFGYRVSAIAFDSLERCWLFIDRVGLCRYDYASGRIILISNEIQTASSLAFSAKDEIWIGTTNGLHHFDLATGSIIRSYTEKDGELSSGNVASLHAGKDKQLWIGTSGGGLDILNLTNGRFSYMRPDVSGKGLSSESVFSIFEDRDKRRWIGTLKGGVNIVDAEKPNFRTVAHQPHQPNSLINDFASCFYEDENKNLWIGTDGGGMSIWNRNTNTFSNYRYQPGNPNSLSNNLVTGIVKDAFGKTWIATFGGGINRFDPATGRFLRYRCMNPETGLENKSVWLLFEDREKTLWAATFGQGALYRYNRQQDEFQRFAPEVFDVFSFFQDAQGAIWAGTASELMQLDPLTGKTQRYPIGKPVRDIFEDSKQNFWVGTEGGGLICFDRKTRSIRNRFSTAEGLSNNAVLSILEDNKGFLWLSTFNGLSRFQHSTKTFRNFYQADGLQSNQFLFRSALRLQSGELVFGGVKGFSIFHPDSLHFGTTRQPLHITGLTVDNQALTPGNDFVAEVQVDMVSTLRIPYDKAALSIQFAALEFFSAAKIQYAYYLEGWDKTWNYPGNLRLANYSRLKEGSYRFYVKATNSGGDWNKEKQLLRIIILPPWYRSWWAYLLYVIIIAGFIILYNRYRVRRARMRYEIKLANLNAEKEKELNERKLSFFTDISHEFRTPLMLIINPLKDILQSGRKIAGDELQVVHRNANRLLRLVDQLLHFQKAGSGLEQMQISIIDADKLCREIFENFTLQAAQKKIDYTYHYSGVTAVLYGDQEKLEIILINLLSNAVKFTGEGGKIYLQLIEHTERLQISIIDTGSGIPEGIGERLFERFYQVKDARSDSKAGFGIGLYLVRQFVDLHKGTVGFTSRPGEGTRFDLEFKKGFAHFDRAVVNHAAPIVSEEVVPVLPAAAAEPETAEAISGRSCILIVEDNEEIREYILGIFSREYQLLQASDGIKGLELARNNLPDLIITDIMMPGSSGIELCKNIKSDPSLSHIPVILLTAAVDSDMKLLGLETGADDYITKPFQKELLIARVSNLIRKRTTLQDYFFNEITLRKTDVKVSAEYRQFLDNCIAVVESHLSDENFSIKTLAKELGMSHSNLYKKIKSISGQSANAFIRFIRLRRAAEILIKTERNVNEAAFEVGINDVKYFREQFNKVFGMNPSEYIKKYRSSFNRPFRVNKDVFGKKED